MVGRDYAKKDIVNWLKMDDDVTKQYGSYFVDVFDVFCNATACPPIINNTITMADFGHITMPFSKMVAPIIHAILKIKGVPYIP
jgi:hypothetical protein